MKMKKLKENVKKILKNILLNHKILLLLVLLIIFTIMPFILLGVINGLDDRMPVDSFTRLKDGDNVWFAFWGSYAGAISSMFLSVCAMYLSVKFERASEKNAMIQQAMAFHQFQIKLIKLYDLKQCYPVRVLDKFSNSAKGSYIIQIQFEKPFPPYFDMKVEKVEWRDGKNTFKHFEYTDAVIESNDKLNIYLLFDPKEDQRQDINLFYHINYFEPQIMLLSERTRGLRLYLVCENQMDYERNMEDSMNLKLEIEMENRDLYKKDYVYLEVMNRRMTYTKEERKEND